MQTMLYFCEFKDKELKLNVKVANEMGRSRKTSGRVAFSKGEDLKNRNFLNPDNIENKVKDMLFKLFQKSL